MEQIALKLAAMPKINQNRPRMVVFTQGADPTIVACEGKITKYPVIPIEPKDIVDTNGAGDAFGTSLIFIIVFVHYIIFSHIFCRLIANIFSQLFHSVRSFFYYRWNHLHSSSLWLEIFFASYDR